MCLVLVCCHDVIHMEKGVIFRDLVAGVVYSWRSCVVVHLEGG